MGAHLVVVDGYFDGSTVYDGGPYTLCVRQGVVAHIEHGECGLIKRDLPDAFHDPGVPCDRGAFAMPGLAEAHAHLFLDGANVDAPSRAAYLKAAGRDAMMRVARANIEKAAAAGITLIRDAGDIHGVNTAIRDELRAGGGTVPAVRAPGPGLRRVGGYGGFMAVEVDDGASIDRAVDRIAPEADDLKIVMSGAVDFGAGRVTGDPQFTPREAARFVAAAARHGLPTFAHCSGLAGIRVAVEAGIGSIEHGFFVDRDLLCRMADAQIAWVPTFAPVQFRWENPHLFGSDAATVASLRRILDDHHEHVRLAVDLGVPVVAGTDAGSFGVDHGSALAGELALMAASGLSLPEVLRSATSRPRARWGEEPADLREGAPANFIVLAESPLKSLSALKTVRAVYRNDAVLSVHASVSHVSVG